MKTKCFLSIMVLGLIVSAFGQKPTLELTFTAIDSASYVQLDSIKVMNRTQDCDTILHWPDTVLVLGYVGMPENKEGIEGFNIFQNYPNPIKDKATINIYIPYKDVVEIIISDVLGRKIAYLNRILEAGYHSFSFIPGKEEFYILSATWRGNAKTIKIIHAGSISSPSCRLTYSGFEGNDVILKSQCVARGFEFSIGDELLYIGYTDTLESGILDVPESNETYIFQFATNIPCPGTPTVEYEGQVYNTIQIFSQCWIKENLNAGNMIQGIENMTDNDTIEKYCYDNEPDSCTKYGGLYQWDEMMQYTTTQGVQGICPPGWHLPTHEEWKVLEGAVDSLYGIGDPEWDLMEYRGYDAGTNLKTTSGWYSNGNGTDLFGFLGLPGGFRNYGGVFGYVVYDGCWWSSTEFSGYIIWGRYLDYSSPEVGWYGGSKDYGFSVRCLRDY